jgi:HSP20 family protein
MAIAMWRPFEVMVERTPFRNLSDIQGEMNRAFDSVFGRPVAVEGERTWAARCDLWETKDELVVAFELPGVNEKDVNVSITDDLLTLRGERRRPDGAQDATFHHVERVYGKFERSIQVTIPVQPDRVKASYRDGVLTVTLPKLEEVKPREIKIDVL